MQIETVRQFFLVYVYLWPIWVILAILIWISIFFKTAYLKKLLTIISIVFVVLIFAMRLLIFVQYPLQQFEEAYSLQDIGDKGIVIMHKVGQLHVKSTENKELQINAKDLKGYKKTKIADYEYVDFGEEISRKALMYQGISAVPLISRVDSDVTISVPANFANKFDILVQEDNAEIDLRGISAAKITINTSYSQLKVILPEGRLAQQVIINGTESEVKISIPPETKVNLLHTNFSWNIEDKLFEKTDNGAIPYIHKGSSAFEVDLELRVNRNLLEFLPLSEHN